MTTVARFWMLADVSSPNHVPRRSDMEAGTADLGGWVKRYGGCRQVTSATLPLKHKNGSFPGQFVELRSRRSSL